VEKDKVVGAKKRRFDLGPKRVRSFHSLQRLHRRLTGLKNAGWRGQNNEPVMHATLRRLRSRRMPVRAGVGNGNENGSHISIGLGLRGGVGLSATARGSGVEGGTSGTSLPRS
jgi:hypothetical protein